MEGIEEEQGAAHIMLLDDVQDSLLTFSMCQYQAAACSASKGFWSKTNKHILFEFIESSVHLVHIYSVLSHHHHPHHHPHPKVKARRQPKIPDKDKPDSNRPPPQLQYMQFSMRSSLLEEMFLITCRI